MPIPDTLSKKKKRRKRGDYFEIEKEGSDHPVHESYVKEEPVKE